MAHTVASLMKSSDLPTIEGQMLLEHATGWSRTSLISYPERSVDAKQALIAMSFFARRRVGEPVAYLTGTREFYGLMFHVSPAVLIPRPETELLVDLLLARLKKNPTHSVLDLGTGSGAVAVTLAKLCDTAQVTGVEKSKAALNIARKNAGAIIEKEFNNKLQLILGDWYQPVGSAKFDIIVSNPPYIAEADAHLSLGDLRHEPIQALTAGKDGLDAIRKIVQGAPEHLNRGGWLLFEHGYNQEKACAALLKQAGFKPIFCEKDSAGIPRVSGGQLK
ncbi:MAG: peptide chain release factor N(5)-glutamine methyltransferase [Burkholderiales bacterium]